jgi:iron uptake system component EfeO
MHVSKSRTRILSARAGLPSEGAGVTRRTPVGKPTGLPSEGAGVARRTPVGKPTGLPSEGAGVTRRTRATGFSALVGLAVLLVACGTQAASPAAPSSGAPAGAPSASAAVITVTVTMTNAGCTPDRTTIPAGPVTFRAVNDGADKVTEVEIEQDGKIVGEKENLAPGLSGTFTVVLAVGEYVIACDGATVPDTAFHVTAGASTGTAGPTDAKLAAATTAYAAYVIDQVGQLVTTTKAFTDAIVAGDIAKSKSLYGPARVFYERIEPVAESFGDLDPEIDERIDDAPVPADFTGFHRLEQALWETGSLAGMTPIATKLMADVLKLQGLVGTETYQPAALANGAAELLDEIAKSKVTGEEERYSHLDLLDFQANLDGARKAFDLLQPALSDVDGALATSIAARFGEVQSALDAHRSEDGFVPFTDVTAAQVKALAQAVDALAEPLSQVAAKLVGS